MNRLAAVWTPMDDEHTDAPHCWAWGDWCITLIGDGYWLIVSSGIEYGPFSTWDAVTEHAENVRGDLEMETYTLCKECGQPTKPGRHKPGEYEHAQGCPKAPKPKP